jgi:Flp pilus assembly protein TadD
MMARGMLDRAMEQARQVLEGNPESTEAAGMLGQLHAQRQEFPAALGYLNRVIEATPGDPRAWSVRAHVHLQMGAPLPAESDFMQALRLNPRDPNTLAALAWLYYANGRPDRGQWAMSELQQVAPQMAQMLAMQMQMGMGAPPPPAAGGGVLQRIVDALR